MNNLGRRRYYSRPETPLAQWLKVRSLMTTYLIDGWSISMSKRLAGLTHGSPICKFYHSDLEFKEWCEQFKKKSIGFAPSTKSHEASS